jgi:hypothetical protein
MRGQAGAGDSRALVAVVGRARMGLELRAGLDDGRLVLARGVAWTCETEERCGRAGD